MVLRVVYDIQARKRAARIEPDHALLPVAISYSFAWWGWVLTVVGILFAGWICYGISWLIEVIIPPYPGAYYYTCFETEAYNHEDDPDYLKRRIPFWGWISCIPNRKVKHK